MQEVQGRETVDAKDYITRQDIEAKDDVRVRHEVVIGSRSMQNSSETLVIKDSQRVSPWFVESIDAMVLPGAQVRVLLL